MLLVVPELSRKPEHRGKVVQVYKRRFFNIPPSPAPMYSHARGLNGEEVAKRLLKLESLVADQQKTIVGQTIELDLLKDAMRRLLLKDYEHEYCGGRHQIPTPEPVMPGERRPEPPKQPSPPRDKKRQQPQQENMGPHATRQAACIANAARRYSREFLMRHSTGALAAAPAAASVNQSARPIYNNMNPHVHPPSAIPPTLSKGPAHSQAGIINMQANQPTTAFHQRKPTTNTATVRPTSISISTANHNHNQHFMNHQPAANFTITTANHHHQEYFCLKPARLNVKATTTANNNSNKTPVTSNGRFEPALSMNGFQHDDRFGPANEEATTKQHHQQQQQGAACDRQSFVELQTQNTTQEICYSNTIRTAVSPFSQFSGTQDSVLTPSQEPANTVDLLSSTDFSQENEEGRAEPVEPREDDNPCRCPLLYSVERQNNNDTSRYTVEELSPNGKAPIKLSPRAVSNPRAETIRYITIGADTRSFQVLGDDGDDDYYDDDRDGPRRRIKLADTTANKQPLGPTFEPQSKAIKFSNPDENQYKSYGLQRFIIRS